MMESDGVGTGYSGGGGGVSGRRGGAIVATISFIHTPVLEQCLHMLSRMLSSL